MANAQLTISSPAFQNEGEIPSRYTCDGENINPPLYIENIPPSANSLVIIVEDPDAPKGNFTHWLVWNIEPAKTIGEDSVPGTVGLNNFGNNSYGGPCPPSGAHRYYFRVYALDTRLTIPPNSDKKALEQAIKTHVIAEGVLMGRYARVSM